jgi:NADH dehydrogenase (ubiquinone) flavoprotein 1
LEDRIANPKGFDPEKHFQTAWSGQAFTNAGWVDKHGEGRTYKQI